MYLSGSRPNLLADPFLPQLIWLPTDNSTSFQTLILNEHDKDAYFLMDVAN